MQPRTQCREKRLNTEGEVEVAKEPEEQIREERKQLMENSSVEKVEGRRR